MSDEAQLAFLSSCVRQSAGPAQMHQAGFAAAVLASRLSSWLHGFK